MKLFKLFIFLIFPTCGIGQNWGSIAAGLDNDVRCFYPDTIANYLYVGGSFTNSTPTLLNGIGKIAGQNWNNLGSGTDLCSSNSCNPVTALCKFNGNMYAGGMFSGAGGQPGTAGIAEWDGSNWQSVGSCNGVVFTLSVYNGALFAGGIFDTIGGIQAFNIAKYNGSVWSAVADTIFKDATIGCSRVYQNHLYIGGNFHNSLLGLYEVAQYDGTDWAGVGTSVFTGLTNAVASMEVYQNKLFVAGYFGYSTGVPFKGIVAWDGNNWNDVGGGLEGPSGFPANVFALCVHQNKLVAGGAFYYAGGVLANNIAEWDGVNWCGLGTTFNSGITAVASFDDTLYIGGGFTSLEGNPSSNYIAKWLAGNFVDTCGNTTGINENHFDYSFIALYPNPASNKFTFNLNENYPTIQILITDQLGRELRSINIENQNSVEISVADLPEGMYFYSMMKNGERIASGKFVVQH